MNNRLRRLIALLLCAVAVCLAPSAWACNAAATGGALGSVNTFRVQSGPAISGSGNMSFTCGSVVLSALTGTPTLKATLQPSVTGLTLKNGAYSIPYLIYSNPELSTPYTGAAVVVNINSNALINLLNSLGGQIPIYINTTPGANIPAGTYTDSLQVTWSYNNICEGLVNVLGLCLGVLNNGSTVTSLIVTLNVTNDCIVTAPPVNFGSAPLVTGFPDVSQNVSLLCSKNMTYTVGLSAGNYASNGRRQMANGSNRLAYDIFKADSTVWGSLTTSRANGQAASDGNTVQTIPYTARIYQDQATPAAAIYTDSVVVDISF